MVLFLAALFRCGDRQLVSASTVFQNAVLAKSQSSTDRVECLAWQLSNLYRPLRLSPLFNIQSVSGLQA
jgi:hypothetical protein